MKADQGTIESCAELLRRCFPHTSQFTPAYLQWLYAENPEGPALGFNAIADDKIVAHYACIPATVHINGTPSRVLLSLNTATAPEFQGQGLFTKLARQTFDKAASEGVVAVYGVANQNSIHGFLKHLQFQNVRALEARVGLGCFVRIDWRRAKEAACFRHKWSTEALSWRLRNPMNRAWCSRGADGETVAEARTNYPLITAYAPLAAGTALLSGLDAGHSTFGLHVTLGAEPIGTASYGLCYPVPDRLKPSPLRLIYRNLIDPKDRLDPAKVLFNFLDFDPY
jgi:predicted N-acetyltransferase YhbS